MKEKYLCAVLSVLLLVTSCSSGQKDTIKLSDMGSTASFYYQEDIPFGTNYQTIFDEYYDEKIDPESDQFEDYRNAVVQENGYRSVTPVKTETMYGVPWTTNFNFDENGLLYLGIYNGSFEREDFEKLIPQIVSDCYDAFGESDLSREEFLSLLLDPENDLVSEYWTADDETFFQVMRMCTSNKVTLSICVGQSDRVSLWSGAKELPSIFK